jgi:hypothetical protein
MFLVGLIILISVFGILFHAQKTVSLWEDSSSDNRAIASVLGICDLSLSTEARYVRNISISDSFSPFQDVICGLDLLPSGSFYHPPPHVGCPEGTIEPD